MILPEKCYRGISECQQHINNINNIGRIVDLVVIIDANKNLVSLKQKLLVVLNKSNFL